MEQTAEQHKYMHGMHSKIFTFTIIINLLLSAAITGYAAITGSGTSMPVVIMGGCNFVLIGIINKLNLHEKPILHKNDFTDATEIASELHQSLIRESHDRTSLQNLSDIVEVKINSFRSRETSVPVWVKHKVMKYE